MPGTRRRRSGYHVRASQQRFSRTHPLVFELAGAQELQPGLLATSEPGRSDGLTPGKTAFFTSIEDGVRGVEIRAASTHRLMI